MSDRERFEDLPAVRELREQLREAAKRDIAARAHHRRRRRLPLALAFGAVLVAGGAGAATLLSTGEPVKELPGKSPRYEAPAGSYPALVTAPDPDGPAPWGVAAYRSAEGQACALAGQVRGGVLGLVEEGIFHPYEPGTGGACGDLTQQPQLYEVPYFPNADRTLIYGRVPSGRKAMAFEVEGKRYSATTGRQGTFLLVFEGKVALADVRPIDAP